MSDQFLSIGDGYVEVFESSTLVLECVRYQTRYVAMQRIVEADLIVGKIGTSERDRIEKLVSRFHEDPHKLFGVVHCCRFLQQKQMVI